LVVFNGLKGVIETLYLYAIMGEQKNIKNIEHMIGGVLVLGK